MTNHIEVDMQAVIEKTAQGFEKFTDKVLNGKNGDHIKRKFVDREELLKRALIANRDNLDDGYVQLLVRGLMANVGFKHVNTVFSKRLERASHRIERKWDKIIENSYARRR